MAISATELARELGELLVAQEAQLCLAESLTGGCLAATVTSVPASGQWFSASFVTYGMEQKTKLLDVPWGLLQDTGPVTAEVVTHMVQNAQAKTGSPYGLAVSGVAGPSGGTKDCPVGTVWFAWAHGPRVWTNKQVFEGDRDSIRAQTVIEGLKGLINVAKDLRPTLG
ncbi:competence/damage-inducible CinA-like protein [Gregarina niphandrodes]|uniref:Competence/damage-inducible CinA-like protein n=1 Tax=Gregarina niphandrodes TaxID=110365 RepID=A0A023B4G9_GRENI|nr:competence/damage-inducible CinA-like protein [Gregarina niphandrodes]EZG56727.1 competence/damage-inducible CinA-like protein [Gregarina niphandrodes]|eukprot:XP_011131195.1 competence/damage-inducible CinA-like protein [Gregarina niphandrodes]